MPPLTPREQQVLQMMVQGDSGKEIARALNLSPRTIEVYRSNLLRKLGARNTVDLVQQDPNGAGECRRSMISPP